MNIEDRMHNNLVADSFLPSKPPINDPLKHAHPVKKAWHNSRTGRTQISHYRVKVRWEYA